MDAAPIIVGAFAVLSALVTAYFAWKAREGEVSAPDRLADGFVSLTADLRTEIVRLNERVDDLERQRKQDVRHIAYLELQVEWLSKRMDDKTRAEFEAVFRPFK